MRKQIQTLLAIDCLVILVGPATASAAGTCKFNGSWYGYLPTFGMDFVGTAHGMSHKKGTYVFEVPGFDPALLGFTDAVKASAFRGSWERVDKRTVSATVLSYAVNSLGQTVVIGKVIITYSFSEDCNTVNIVNTTKLYAPDQDPFGEAGPAYGSFVGAPHSAKRIRVDAPPAAESAEEIDDDDDDDDRD